MCAPDVDAPHFAYVCGEPMRAGSNLLVLLLALIMGGVAAFLARDWLISHASPTTEAEPMGSVVVASEAIKFGGTLGNDNLAEMAWPSKTIPENTFAHVQDLTKDGSRVALTSFVRNEPIVAAKVTGPGQRASLSTTIESGKRAVTIAVDDVRGVAGFIFPGDYVDVALTRSTSSTGDDQRDFSEVVLQHVKVLAIDQSAGERQEKPTIAKAVTVEVTSEQALKVLLASNSGRLSLILRHAAEDPDEPNLKVTQHDLFPEAAMPPEPAPAPKEPAPVLQPLPIVTLPSPAPPAPAPAASAPVEPPPTESIAALSPPEPLTRKVTIVRGMKRDDYDVLKQP